MREILFRGKAINRDKGYRRTEYKNGDWVYGLLTRPYDERFESLPAEMTNTSGISGIEVDYKSIGQFTGLADKNGKKIYEGDIVKMLDYQTGVVTYEFGAFGINVITGIDYDYLDSEIAEVTGCNNCSYFCRSDNFISLYELMWNYNQENDNCDVVEVIGNIYDNPEMAVREV